MLLLLLFSLLELLVQSVEFLHLFDSLSVLFLGTQTRSRSVVHDGLPLDGRGGLTCCFDLIYHVGVDEVLKGRRVKFFQTIFDFFLRGEFEEVLETIPLVIVNVNWQLVILLFSCFVLIS